MTLYDYGPYLQIAAIIKRGILSGQYPPDTRIPTE